MNEKAKAELVRQLAGGCKFFVKCTRCGGRFAGEMPSETCPSCDFRGVLMDDPEEEKIYYRGLIDHAINWGNRE